MLFALAGLAEGAEPPLEPGVYRLDMHQASTSKLPLMGRTHSAWVSVSLARIEQGSDGWVQSHRVCGVRFDTGFPLVGMEMADALLHSLRRPSYAVELEPSQEAGETVWSYRADFGAEHVGYRPAGEDDDLPRRSDDPAVTDSDGDGHPGATLRLVVPVLDPFDLYVVQRRHAVLRGQLADTGQVEGSIEFMELEQRVIGAEPYFLKRSPKLAPDPDNSHFRLQRVAADATCESLLAAGASGSSGTRGGGAPAAGDP